MAKGKDETGSKEADSVAPPGSEGDDKATDLLFHLSENLASELRSADVIMKCMLNAMTVAQKSKLAKLLEDRGVSPDGMIRARERHDELARFDAAKKRLKLQ